MKNVLQCSETCLKWNSRKHHLFPFCLLVNVSIEFFVTQQALRKIDGNDLLNIATLDVFMLSVEIKKTFQAVLQ